MSSKKLCLIPLFILVLGFAVSANADTLYFSTMYLNGVNGQVDPYGRVYISPYLGGLNDPQANDYIYCVDPDHDSSLHTSWTVNVTQLEGAGLSNTYLKNQQTYEEIAWLIFSPSAGYLSGNQNLAHNQDIQAAIWYLADNSSRYGQNNSWVTQAGSGYGDGTVSYSKVYILSDTSGANQEFMIDPEPTGQVPEPATLLLLGSGLIGLWVFKRKFGGKG